MAFSLQVNYERQREHTLTAASAAGDGNPNDKLVKALAAVILISTTAAVMATTGVLVTTGAIAAMAGPKVVIRVLTTAIHRYEIEKMIDQPA